MKSGKQQKITFADVFEKNEKRKARNFFLRNAVLQFRTQRARYFSSLIETTLFNTSICNRNLLAYERDETWFLKLLNNDGDPNFDIRWRNEFNIPTNCAVSKTKVRKTGYTAP